MVQFHTIQPKNKSRKKKRIGRGGKRGTYSGRGLKGQKSRAGRKIRPQMRDVIKKIPKKRGYRFKSIKEKPVVINLAKIDKKFEAGAEITPASLLAVGLISRQKGKMPKVKLLSSGKITKKLLVRECQISKKAKEKIEKAGGEIDIKNQK